MAGTLVIAALARGPTKSWVSISHSQFPGIVPAYATMAIVNRSQRLYQKRGMCDGSNTIRRPAEGRRRSSFVDKSRVIVAGGRGGAGTVSFFRDTRTQWGGPDGGPGGDGGTVIIRACSKLIDLARDRYTYSAGNGANGKGKNRIGIAGENVVIEVPVGTLVKVFPASEGFLGPEALLQDEWGLDRLHKSRRNHPTRIKEVDDQFEDTPISNYFQQLEADENRKTSAPAGPRLSKFQTLKQGRAAKGKGALRKSNTHVAGEEDAVEEEERWVLSEYG